MWNTKRQLAKNLVLTLNVQSEPGRKLFLNAQLNNTDDKDYFIRLCSFPSAVTRDNVQLSGPSKIYCMPNIGKESCASESLYRDKHFLTIKLPAYGIAERHMGFSGACNFVDALLGTYNVTALYSLSLYGDPNLQIKASGGGVVTATTSFELMDHDRPSRSALAKNDIGSAARLNGKIRSESSAVSVASSSSDISTSNQHHTKVEELYHVPTMPSQTGVEMSHDESIFAQYYPVLCGLAVAALAGVAYYSKVYSHHDKDLHAL